MKRIILVPAFIVAFTEDNGEAEARAAQLAESVNEAARKEPDHDGTVLLLDEVKPNRYVHVEEGRELPHAFPDGRQDLIGAATLATLQQRTYGCVYIDAVRQLQDAVATASDGEI